MSALEADDVPLPLMPDPTPPLTAQGETDMSALPIGSSTRVPELPGRWSVWSQSAESPGAHFLVPLDDEARTVGIKYAVVRAKMARGAAEPILTIIRTEPEMKRR